MAGAGCMWIDTEPISAVAVKFGVLPVKPALPD
jgi:hypothetical protein